MSTMKEQFGDILDRYSKEVEQVKRIFEAGRANPPISKNQPPVAGAIFWAKSLYLRVKHTIMRFRSHPDLLADAMHTTTTTTTGSVAPSASAAAPSSAGSGKPLLTVDEVCKQYIRLARSIYDYEKELLAKWAQHANSGQFSSVQFSGATRPAVRWAVLRT